MDSARWRMPSAQRGWAERCLRVPRSLQRVGIERPGELKAGGPEHAGFMESPPYRSLEFFLNKGSTLQPLQRWPWAKHPSHRQESPGGLEKGPAWGQRLPWPHHPAWSCPLWSPTQSFQSFRALSSKLIDEMNRERSQRERDQEKLKGIPEGLVMSPLRGDCRPFGPAHCYDLGLPALPLYKAREITQEVRSKDTMKEHTGRGL